METLAFIHAAVAYESSPSELTLHLPEDWSTVVASSTKIGLIGTTIALSTIGPNFGAFAVVKRGDACPAVQDVQRALVREGYNPGSVDGVFGNSTEYAVKRFQKDTGLTSDGRVGARTADALGLGDVENANSPYVAGRGCSTNANNSGGGGGGAPTAVRIVTTGGNLRVRSGPGTNYPVTASLANGSVVRTTGKTQNGWTQLVSQAWVATQYTRPTTEDNGGGGGGGAPASSQIQIVTTGGNLRVRSGPGTNYASVASLGNGSIVRTTGSVSNGWIQINGGGWVASRYTRPASASN